jgi:hypothetical protein
MKKLYNIILLCLIAFPIVSCEKDNMAGPNAKFYGEIVDANTGELIGQDIYNGSLIRYVELGYKDPPIQVAYFKVDGTFRNNLMFSGDYDFFLNQGNFVPDTLRNVRIKKGDNHYTFKVVPYITLSDVKISQTGSNTVTGTFKVKQNTTDKISKIGIFCHRENAVGNGTKYDLWQLSIDNDVPSDYELTISMDLSSVSSEIKRGKTYFFRVGALSSAPAAKYNYAPAVQLTLW